MKTVHQCVVLAALLSIPLHVHAQPVSNSRTVTVSNSGSGANYSSLSAALSAITDASSTNKYTILVYPGTYTGCNNGGALLWKSYVSLKGLDRDTTIIKGSCNLPADDQALIDFTNVTGVEVNDITIDGTAQLALNDGDYYNGVSNVCGASIVFNHVRLVNGTMETSPAYVLNTVEYAFQATSCAGPGSVTIRDSDVGPIVDGGGDWTIQSSRITAQLPSSTATEYEVAFLRYIGDEMGRVTVVGSTIESLAGDGSSGLTAAIYTFGEETSSSEMRIIGSTIVASGVAGSVTAAIYEQSAGTSIFVEGSLLTYQSPTSATSGEFYGIYVPASTGTPVSVRASTIMSLGSGGTRADVYAAYSTSVDLTTTQYSSFAGDGATSTSDVRQGKFAADLIIPLTAPTLGPVNGQIWIDPSTNKLFHQSGGITVREGEYPEGAFSSDLIIPLTSPTLGPVNGQIWIDTGTNKLCYRSGGTTRCVLGS